MGSHFLSRDDIHTEHHKTEAPAVGSQGRVTGRAGWEDGDSNDLKLKWAA